MLDIEKAKLIIDHKGNYQLLAVKRPSSYPGVYYCLFQPHEGRYESSHFSKKGKRVIHGFFKTEVEACVASVGWELKNNILNTPAQAMLHKLIKVERRVAR